MIRYLRPLLAAGLLCAALPIAHAASDSAVSGRKAYALRCASCHGGALEGAGAPALAGPSFQSHWTGHGEAELYDEIARKMPQNAAGSLSEPEYRAIFAYVRAKNAYKIEGGKLMLPPDASMGIFDTSPVPAGKLPEAPDFVAQPSDTGPAQGELTDLHDGDWPMYNRDYRGQRYSPLAEITPANVKSLAPRCIFQTGEVGAFQVSPILYRNRLYVTTAHNTFAVDPTNCRKIWESDYIPDGVEGLNANRGPAVADGRLFRGTPDGHLLALDAATGKVLWDAWVADSRRGYNLSPAPVVFEGKVYIGQGGADRGALGHIYAFDAATGKLVWTFDPVPKDGEPGSETWDKPNTLGGGGSWSTITVDPEHHLLYVPIGNPGSDIDGSERPGDNLYTDAVVVLDARTGKLVWYAQQVPHDLWDWDTAAAPAIYDLDGNAYMAVTNKGGWLYLYDRKTHKLIAKQELTRHENVGVPPTVQGLHVCPGTLGGVEWNGPALDPKRGLVFVNTADWCVTLTLQSGGVKNNFGGALKFDPPTDAKGWLRAFDAKTGAPKWTYQSDSPMIAGVTPTGGGLVFTGSLDGDLLGFDAETGNILYRFNTGGAIAGGISSYAIDGKQYLAVASGNSSKTIWVTKGAPTLIVFGLP